LDLLLDTCVWGKAAEELTHLGYDTVWAGSWPEDPGDSEILSRAFQERRVLVTLDKDFGELAILKGKPHGGIIRLVNIPARSQASTIVYVMEKHSNELAAGAIVTADRTRLRVRMSDK